LPALQTLLTALNGNQGNRDLQGGSNDAGPRDDSIETALVDILSYLQTQNNFQEILSTTSDYSQTLAHLSIFYGYPSLLRHLVEWGIDLAISDINGLTALHCAFMKGDLDSVRILRRGGAPETVTDKLGRTPSDLQPDGFGLAIDLDGEVVAGLDTEMWPEETDTDEGGEGGGGGGPSRSGGGQIASSSKEPAIIVMNQSLLDRNRWRKKHSGPRILPDTPNDASIGNMSSKLFEAETEADTIDFLVRGILPNGKIWQEEPALLNALLLFRFDDIMSPGMVGSWNVPYPPSSSA